MILKSCKNIRCAVVGYGSSYDMGKAHCGWITSTEGFELVAVCDLDEKRTEAAKKDFPWIQTYNELGKMLDKQDIDLVSVVTPHNTHAKLAIQCLKEGKHVIVEKPMCITTDEATSMIEEAKKRNLMLSVFQNRRWDGNYLAIKEFVDKGLIGKIFHLEMFGGGYNHPGYGWLSDKNISGGTFFASGGPHWIDWILNLIPERMVGITGFFHKLVWNDTTNADHVEAIIHFKSGSTANIQESYIASIIKPFIRILGTKGGIIDDKAIVLIEDKPAEIKMQYKKTEWSLYYKNIADHLFHGAKLIVKPEQSRRVISVMETAEKSATSGKTEKPPFP
jgi:predicted dehydrogenase